MMFDYIWLAAIAWFMGFFPLFEIYLAIPTAMGLGLDIVSAVFWSWLGNFIVIPFIVYFYKWLTKFNKIQTYFTKLENSTTSKKLRKGGFIMVLVGTPIFGSWAVAAAGRMIGMRRNKLYLSSAISIALYGVLIGILTQLGIDALFLS
ncbi:Putative small multi-drug export protein [Salisediminibacterium halotolerans]|uniref:Small multi-drug export protein n=2 Tax=Salisediminibacterium halotolerans TaxID=517425 RepID=A0A1H9SU86_9BACI|nr:Putative small multi-drug export protein [Salisediminibacterium haloalkalitolerans]